MTDTTSAVTMFGSIGNRDDILDQKSENTTEFSINNINISRALYIKLGGEGIWEKECIKDGTLRLGYQNVPDGLCREANWTEALAEITKTCPDRGAATRHLSQVKNFYEAPEDVLWITFSSDRMWWCFAYPEVQLNDDGSKTRKAINGWSDKDVNGQLLLKNRISGKLLATQGFRGTICSVKELDYVLCKIKAKVNIKIELAQQAFLALTGLLIPLIKSLHQNDLETLTDLIFRHAGWNRIGVQGGTEKDIDLDLISSLTGERVAVQVKSRANKAVYEDYKNIFADMQGFSKFYFVTHTPAKNLQEVITNNTDEEFIFWGPQDLAEHSARSGLIGWILDKAN